MTEDSPRTPTPAGPAPPPALRPAGAPALARAWPWWFGFAALVGIAGVLTVIAYREGLPGIFHRPHVDKVVHFWVAGLLAFFLDGALGRRSVRLGQRPVPLAAILVLVPSGIEEYAQRYAEFRTSSVWDFAADVAGVIVLLRLSRRLAR